MTETSFTDRRTEDQLTEDQLTEDLRNQLRALDGLRDEDIDLSDIPEQGQRTDWVRGLSIAR